MSCIEKIYSVSVLVGTGQCNGKCKFCSGNYLRKYAPKKDGEIPEHLEEAIRLCSKYGGWSLSITSSGEPLLSPNAVTEALKINKKLNDSGFGLPFVNLFTNGIEITKNPEIATKWFPLWRSLGLTAVAVSIHSVDHKKQAEVYGMTEDQYPNFKEMFNIIRNAGLVPRITLLLRKGEIDNAKKYKKAIDFLIDNYGIDQITSWKIASVDGYRTKFSPSILGELSIKLWLKKNTELVMGQVFGGGVFSYRDISVRNINYVSPHTSKDDFIRQFVVFQDGRVSYSWYQKGQFCLAGSKNHFAF